jgi:hypothetical protein
MRFISPAVHGFLDYVIAIVLIAEPFVLFSKTVDPLVYYFPVVAGVGLVGYSLLTDNSMSARCLIPFKLHLMIDLVAVVTFIALPFILEFGGIERLFYIGLGGGGVLFVLCTNPNQRSDAARSKSHVLNTHRNICLRIASRGA